ncbi:MAG: hypothetical protein WBM39_02305 [Parasphingorhabdus sp.]
MNGLQERQAWQKIAAYRPDIAGFDGGMRARQYGGTVEVPMINRFAALIWLRLNRVYALSLG